MSDIYVNTFTVMITTAASKKDHKDKLVQNFFSKNLIAELFTLNELSNDQRLK